MTSRAKKITSFSFMVCIIVVGGMFLYYQYMNRQKVEEAANSTPTTEVGKLIDKDIEGNYPDTPTEVVKLYMRYTKCMYNEKTTEEEQRSLIGKMEQLYTTEFLTANNVETEFANWTTILADNKESNRKIASYTVTSNSGVEYNTVKGKKQAVLQASIFLGQKSGYTKSYQEYILQKENDVWKILGFRQAADTTTVEEPQQTPGE